LDCRRYVDYISAAALVVDRALFMAVGGFDMAFEPAYYEDTDLCLKLASQGRRILLCPEIKVIHIEGSSANGDVLAEQRRTRLGDLNRAKFVSRWGRYLRDRDVRTLERIGRDVVPAELRATAAPIPGRPRALIFTPYNLTPGGGERYLLTLATALTSSHDVILVTQFPYSQLRLRSIGAELGLDVSQLHLRHRDQIDQEGPFDVQITMGNQICPDIAGQAALNIYHCQFPFPQARTPSDEEVARLETYDALLVNSEYTSLHSHAALYADRLSERPVHVLHPPVGLLAAGEKRPHRILSVGRFFTGGHTKRQDLLIEAFKTLCERFDGPLELHLAGSSTPNNDSMQYLSDLMAAAEGYPIHFHVNCPPPTLHDLYASAPIYWHGTGLGVDLVANPSAAEHFGITIVEAMSAGAVPFALASGGIREVIRSGENGFLYRDQNDLVEQTLAFLGADARHQSEVRDGAILRAQDFATAQFTRRFQDLLRGLHPRPGLTEAEPVSPGLPPR
jgi:glycosyltransferase involved in cell wall biosynthesis